MVITPNFAFAGGGVQAGSAEAVAARVDARSASESCIFDMVCRFKGIKL